MSRAAAALKVLVAAACLAIAGSALAQSTVAPMTMDEMNQFVADVPGPKFARTNQLKSEVLQAAFAGADLAALEPRLHALAEEYARASGADLKIADAHMMLVGAQLTALGKDPTMRTHLGDIQTGR